jgi:hypothetical protein
MYCSWKEWCYLAHEYGLLASDNFSIMDLQGRIPYFKLFTMNIGVSVPFWRD